MQSFLSRRSVVLALLSAPLLPGCANLYSGSSTANRKSSPLMDDPAQAQQPLLSPTAVQQSVKQQVNVFLAQLEKQAQGRLGLSAINTANQMRIDYRASERFPLCSTFKLVAVAAILQQSMHNASLLQQHIDFTLQQVQDSGYAPITAQHVDRGMTVSELCAACISYSDNAAANLLLQILGGPAALTRFTRHIGDHIFRLDRWEPALNTALPHDERDTSTPTAMTNTLQRLLLGNVLAPTQRELLLYWLKNNTTGNARIRAGVPNGWIVGDKTGTGAYGTSNDIGIVWPTQQAPIILAIYFTCPDKTAKPNDAIIASASRIVCQALR
ncbi:class A beta-lactamase [Alkanindiges illinoisensis]|uniref:class A beta-lactamase n=1 Tax=Alkanindiges illinoisensis TaxID=197183 RepID=UPI00047D5439|nr:class A beta-lactamase [Alkanindiges illinoisensis]